MYIYSTEYNNNICLSLYSLFSDAGICYTDFTSPNINADVWTVYHLLITFVIPYLIVLASYTLIYKRSVQTNHY
jgi:hypothetical protein